MHKAFKLFSFAVAFVLTLVFCIGAYAGGTVDLQSLSDEELAKLISEAQDELNRRAEKATASSEWREEDFAFYNEDGSVALTPSTGSDFWISIKNVENGRTYRGLRIGDSAETARSLYDLSDAQWHLQSSDISKELAEKWTEEGYSSLDVLDQITFLSAKGQSFYLELAVYREEGRFVTESQLTYPGLEKDVDELVQNSLDWNIYSEDTPMEQIREDSTTVAKWNYHERHRRASIIIYFGSSGKVSGIEIIDDYYRQLEDAYNDDGTVNEDKAYILELK